MARPTDAALLARVRRVAARMLGEGRMLATAESCTGGLIAKCVTDLPGSSAWFERGWVTYTDRAKREELGVPAAVLKRHGAVSEAVARAMVRGVLRESGADVAVGGTGVVASSVGTVSSSLAPISNPVFTNMPGNRALVPSGSSRRTVKV